MDSEETSPSSIGELHEPSKETPGRIDIPTSPKCTGDSFRHRIDLAPTDSKRSGGLRGQDSASGSSVPSHPPKDPRSLVTTHHPPLGVKNPRGPFSPPPSGHWPRNPRREGHTRFCPLIDRGSEAYGRTRNTQRSPSSPPSSDGSRMPSPQSLRTPSGKKSGGQPGHKGDTLLRVENPDMVVEIPVTCCSCGEDLSHLPIMGHERRQVFDLPSPRLEVTEYRLAKVCCPSCPTTVTAPAPPHVTAPTQYGPRFLSYLVDLPQDQCVPLSRVCQISSDLFGTVVSEGTILRACQIIDPQLAPFVDSTRECWESAPVVHVDETRLRVNGRNSWGHVASTSRLTLLGLHEKRGREGTTTLGVVPSVGGTVVSDFWGPYLSFPSPHAFCNAPILPELTAIAEFDPHVWPLKMAAFLLDLKEKTASRVSLVREAERKEIRDAFSLSSSRDGKRPAAQSPKKGEDEPRPPPPRTSSGASKKTPAKSSLFPSTPSSPSPTIRRSRTSG